MRIAICDDDKVIVDNLHSRIRMIADRRKINTMISDFNDGSDLLYEIETKGIFDIIFMDIEIGCENGLELAEKLNDSNYSYILILISQYSDYYRATFEVQPFWFLDKPVNEQRLQKALLKAVDKIKNNYETLDYCFAKEFHRVLIKKIIYLQSSGRLILIKCIESNLHKFYGKLDKIEHLLKMKNSIFIRINKSVCVNIDYVVKWSRNYVRMVNGEEINIGRTYQSKVRESFTSYVKEKHEIYD